MITRLNRIIVLLKCGLTENWSNYNVVELKRFHLIFYDAVTYLGDRSPSSKQKLCVWDKGKPIYRYPQTKSNIVFLSRGSLNIIEIFQVDQFSKRTNFN